MSSQCDLFDISTLTVDEWAVWNIVQWHSGRARAICVKKIASHVFLNERYIRSIIKSLIENHHKPIGSSPGNPPGYYLITDRYELRETRTSLFNRAISIMRRIRAYDPERSESVSRIEGQLNLLKDRI